MLKDQNAKRTRAARAPNRMKEELRRVLNPGASILGMSSVFEYPTGIIVADYSAKSDASDRKMNAQGFREGERDDECGSGRKVDRGARRRRRFL